VRLVSAFILVLAIAAASAGAQTTPPAGSVPGEAVFAVSGRGWGHGVGMSQYGAYGQAKEGRAYDEILAYYYSGTDLGRATQKEVRVLLLEGRRAVSVSSAAPWSAVDATGKAVKLPAGPIALTAELRIPQATGPLEAPLVLRPGKAPLSVDGIAYRGRLELAAQKGFLRVVNHVGLEDYIQGVVADEMPHTWPAEALKAQAVAARSYALKSVLKGKPYDLYSDVRSQVYGGIAAEEPQSTAAVRATAGRVVTYGGQIATTYYFSTSGGKTASAADVFGFAVPYLVSRPDPWDKASPYHRWGPVLVGARTVQSKLGAPSRVLDASGVVTPSGRIRSLTLQTASGATSVPASLVRTALGLRSTWISFGVLRLDRPRGVVEYGSPLRLTGVARNILEPQLAASAGSSAWTTVGPLERTRDGLVSHPVQPSRATRYRIEGTGTTGRVLGQVLLVRVAPRVRLAANELGGLSGTVRPRLKGAPVVVERQRGTGWARVGDAVTDAGGSFVLEAIVGAGTYRARIPAVAGLSDGVSPALVVG
jgi:stage II sporulation protein D